ncbi:MAG: hypothetical protein [Bacteriophage sp.]|nr:MAG: hypothetical protein [Bacteriophage sp.]
MKTAKTNTSAMSNMVAAMAAPIAKAAPKAKGLVAPKAAVKASAKPVARKFDNPIKFMVRGNGAARLFAYTAAWLDQSGLIYGGEFPAELVKKLGGSALAYHTREGNFVVAQGMAKLTAKGLEHFRSREEQEESKGRFDPCDKEDYKLMMVHGFADNRLIKSDATIIPLTA